MYRARERCRRVLKPPLGLLLLLGVLAMHGFQSSSSPSDMTGVPLTAMSAGHHAVPSASASVHHSPGAGHPGADHQDHPGGQVCLAMLSMISFLGAIAALVLREPMTVVRRLLDRGRILRSGRPPPRPSLHLLSVLRL